MRAPEWEGCPGAAKSERSEGGASERAEAAGKGSERSDLLGGSLGLPKAGAALKGSQGDPLLGGVPGPPKAGAALKGSLQRGGERTERSEVKRERVSGANEATSK